MQYTVPKPLFDEMVEAMSCSAIVEKNRARAAFRIQGRWIVVTGGISSHHQGYYLVWGYEFQYLADYKGELTPLDYSLHYDAVTSGERERGYAGLKIKLEGNWIVFIGSQIEIRPSQEGQQLQLFA